jgi:hypothetical protein
MASINLQQALSRGFRGGSTGDAVGDIQGAFAVFLVEAFPFNDEGLADMGKIEVSIEGCGRPDLPRLDAAVIGRGVLYEIGCLPVLEEVGDILL